MTEDRKMVTLAELTERLGLPEDRQQDVAAFANGQGPWSEDDAETIQHIWEHTDRDTGAFSCTCPDLQPKTEVQELQELLAKLTKDIIPLVVQWGRGTLTCAEAFTAKDMTALFQASRESRETFGILQEAVGALLESPEVLESAVRAEYIRVTGGPDKLLAWSWQDEPVVFQEEHPGEGYAALYARME